MVKTQLPEKIILEVAEYKKILQNDNLSLTNIYVFGSYAKGNPRNGSDIDVAVISPDFKSPWSALDYLYSKLPYGKGWTIEPVGFSPADFGNKYSSLINEIKMYGVEV
jgi:predicted nucleotidyltransferase